ncbi:MAG: DNA cytosine methyltransferase [Thermoplasmatales archaeon]
MNVISLFCGAGGMDYGFEKAGHHVIWANDVDRDACKTYEMNLGRSPILKDIREIPSSDIPDAEIVVGGFPCQGFSVANIYRSPEDGRNELYKELLRVIHDKNPLYFVAENVPGLCSLGGYDSASDKALGLGKVFKVVLNDFKKAGKIGYNVSYKVLDAYFYGVPQRRRRIIIIGTRADIFPAAKHPEPVSNNSGLTVRSAIGNLPEPIQLDRKSQKGYPPTTKINGYYNHYGTKHKVKITGYLGNRPTDWDRPSPTITGRGGGTGGPVIMPHPDLERRMTVREYARLQSFPDNFVFWGHISSQYRQIGNAVPWPMAYHIAKQIPVSSDKVFFINQMLEWPVAVGRIK